MRERIVVSRYQSQKQHSRISLHLPDYHWCQLRYLVQMSELLHDINCTVPVDNGGSFGTAFDNSSVMKCNCTADLGSSPSPMMSWQVVTVDNGGSFETTFKVTIDESDLFQNFFLSFYFVMQSGIISTISLVGLCRIHRTIPWRKRQRLHLDGVFYLVNLLPALPTTMCFIAAVILFFTFAYKFTFEKKSNHCRPRHYSLIQKCQSRCYQSVKDMAKVGAGVLCIPTGELFLDTIRQFICSFC